MSKQYNATHIIADLMPVGRIQLTKGQKNIAKITTVHDTLPLNRWQ